VKAALTTLRGVEVCRGDREERSKGEQKKNRSSKKKQGGFGDTAILLLHPQDTGKDTKSNCLVTKQDFCQK